MPRALCLGLLLLLCCGAVPADAEVSVAVPVNPFPFPQRIISGVSVSGDAGAQRIVVEEGERSAIVSSPTDLVVAGTGCVQLDAHAARCEQYVQYVTLGDGDDRLAWAGGPQGLDTTNSIVYGQDGRDHILVERDVEISGGPGRDTLLGGAGNQFFADAAVSEDVRGGGGFDHLALPVGGPARRSVRDFSGIEGLTGTAKREVLVGDAGDNALSSSGGGDLLIGGPGADRLGVWEDDRVRAGPGRDVISASDLTARAMHGARVDCGPGRDIVVARRAFARFANCERFASPFGEPLIDTSGLGARRPSLEVGCRTSFRCRVTLVLTTAGRPLPPIRATVDRGAWVRVPVRRLANARRVLVTANVVNVERDGGSSTLGGDDARWRIPIPAAPLARNR